ncbi:MAG: hypothetical protein K2W92_03575 [Alphaproteobacteria bacterium]|nr:hypothetical protein [Alphaproteobacteria bacterium]
MQLFEAYEQFYPNTQEIFSPLIKIEVLKNKVSSSSSRKHKVRQVFTFSQDYLFPCFFKKELQDKETSVAKSRHRATQCIALIKDPLWKLICLEIINMMGHAAVLKLWDSSLGTFNYHRKTMDLYCKKEEGAQFLRQYSFVILGSLQRYFPAMKGLRIKIKKDV